MWGVIPGPPLESILDSHARINVWDGPVRSAKTVHSLIRWVEFILTAPPGDLAMVGKTEDTLERNILRPLERATDGAFSFSKGSHTFRLADRQGYLFGANDEKAEGKIRGVTLAGLYGDELTLWPPGFFKQSLARLSVPGAKLFGTTNPDSPYHWLKVEYLDRAKGSDHPSGELDLLRFGWPLDLNTYLDPEYVANLKREYTGLWFDRFILGLWKLAEGAVYDFFNEDAHTLESAPGDATEYVVACDYGTSNATVFGLFGINRTVRPYCWLEREYHHSGRDTGHSKTDDEYADDFVNWLKRDDGEPIKPRRVLLDPSAASFKAALRKRGYTIQDANNDVVDGIRTQARMLKAGEYAILKACRQTIRDYGAYLWDKRAQERGEDKPLKQNDHCFIAGTPVLTTHGVVPIEAVQAGDYVLTRVGYRPVLKAGMTLADAEVLTVEFSNGATLTATPSHPIFVQGKGFTRLDRVRYGDKIITVWDESKPWSTKASPSAATRTRNASQTASTTGRTLATFARELKRCIARYGAITTGLFLTASRFITATATRATTTPRTSNASHGLFMWPRTSGSQSASAGDSTWQRCRKQRASGTLALRDARGTRKLQRLLTRLVSRSNERASNAGSLTAPPQARTGTAFVPTLASLPLVERRALMRSLELAAFVDVTSRPTSTARLGTAHVVAAPRPAGRADVYDLTVLDLPEFFAGGVLVHNTKDCERYFLHSTFGKPMTATVRPPVLR
jgi:PBSX family phage terminase large subunit